MSGFIIEMPSRKKDLDRGIVAMSGKWEFDTFQA